MPQELQSPELQAWAAGFPLAVAHAAIALALLVAGSTLYGLISPQREIQLARAGNRAAAIAGCGVVVGLALPLAVSLTGASSIADVILWGVAAVFVQLAVFRLIDLLLRGLPQRVRDGDLSAAALLASAKIASAMIFAAALVP